MASVESDLKIRIELRALPVFTVREPSSLLIWDYLAVSRPRLAQTKEDSIVRFQPATNYDLTTRAYFSSQEAKPNPSIAAELIAYSFSPGWAGHGASVFGRRRPVKSDTPIINLQAIYSRYDRATPVSRRNFVCNQFCEPEREKRRNNYAIFLYTCII